jgi:Cu(I)/Ag(I) efflux system periplasmic protein CusF
MKTIPLISASLLSFSLAACGNAQDSAPAAAPPAEAPMETGASMDMTSGDDAIGRATGTIRSVGSLGDSLTIDHGPFEGGIAMGAMTMGFDTVAEIDLSGFSDGDEVAFEVKQGRDGAYRIMAICNIATDGADCLDKIARN